jgi:hypothetical protein
MINELADFRPKPIPTPPMPIQILTPERIVRRIDQRRGRPLGSKSSSKKFHMDNN